jgi:hypothetical protein
MKVTDARRLIQGTIRMVRGSCLSGAVALEVNGDITPIQLCHATRCRKVTGVAASPELLVSAAGLRWVRGTELIRVYEAPLLDEPPAYRRAFCDTCGSPLRAELEGSGFALVNPGVLDDDPGTREFRHDFVSQKAPWHQITDGLPVFDSRPPVPKGIE